LPEDLWDVNLNAMANRNTVHERVDIGFSGRRPHGMNADFIKNILVDRGACFSKQDRRKSCALVALPGGGVALNRQGLTLISSGSLDVIGMASEILSERPRLAFESLVYQRSSGGAANKDFRMALGRIRSGIGKKLGPAVVAESTAMFYGAMPPTGGILRSDFLRITGVSPWLDFDGKPLLSELGFASLFAGAEKMVSCSSLPARSILATRGEELMSLQVIRTKPNSGMGLVCFEFSGRLRGRVGAGVAKVLRRAVLRNVSVEVLHSGGGKDLPAIGQLGKWRTSALGSVEAISHYVLDPASISMVA
jgi:hypothetical protein